MLRMNLNPRTASRTVFFVACLMSVASASWSMDLLQAYEAAKNMIQPCALHVPQQTLGVSVCRKLWPNCGPMCRRISPITRTS